MNRAAIACCCLLAAAVQARVIAVSPTPAPDAIRYLAVAREISAHGWLTAFRGSDEHPLYPLVVAGVEQLRLPLTSASTGWVVAAQLISAVCAVAVVPLSWLALRRLVDQRAAIGAAVCLALWPMLARCGADALADSLQWLAVAAAWACLVRSGHWFAMLGGVALGLGSLARAEVYVVLVAFVIAELVIPSIEQASWPNRGLRLASLGFGFTLAPLVLLALSQPMGAADAAARLLGRPRVDRVATSASVDNSNAVRVPIKERAVSSRFAGLRPAARAFVREVGNAGNWLWAPLVAGVLLGSPATEQERASRRRAGVVSLLYAGLVVMAASRLGYLTERHVLLSLYFLLPWVGLGAAAVWDRANDLLQRTLPIRSRAATCGAVAVAGGALALAILEAVQPVHLSRENHRRAADWLAASSTAGAVFDTRGWTELYSGRTTYRVDRSAEALRDPRLAFVVLEARELRPENRRSASLRAVLATGGELVHRCATRGDEGATVLVYRWHPERLAARPAGAVSETPRPLRDA